MIAASKVQHRNNVHIRESSKASDGSGHGIGRKTVTVIFAHGFGCDQNMWRYFLPAFDTGYRTILYDLVGCGQADPAAYDYQKYSALDGYADDLLEIIDAFGDGPVVLVGHSVSATIGAIAAVRAPERFAALVMVAPSFSLIDDGDYVGGFSRADMDDLLKTLESNYLGWASAAAPSIMGAPEQPELGIELADSLCRTDPDIAKHFARVVFLSDYREILPKVTVPTLIVQSSEDFLAPLVVGEYIHSKLPDSTLKVISNVGHCPHLSAPYASMSATVDFLRARDI